MNPFDPKIDVPVDVVVLGEHPSAYLTAALLRAGPTKRAGKVKGALRVVHAALPDDQPADRLVVVNPALFDLHPLLEPIGKSLWTTPIRSVRFLADDAATWSEHRATDDMASVARYRDLRDALAKVAWAEGVECVGGADPTVIVHRADETGVDLTVGGHDLRATAVVLAGRPTPEMRGPLGLPDGWSPESVRRFSSVRSKAIKHLNLGGKAVLPMSLDLGGDLSWAWLLAGEGEYQLTIEQRLTGRAARPGAERLAEWVAVLQRHGVLGARFTFDPDDVTQIDLPLAGALDHEGVANRTLLVGPAGGFYSACGEEVYPACWSGVFAADVLRKALKQEHLQDALADYRQVWRTTLGEYLRGPEQNLRLLLPLVYRNPVMTTRLAEAVLLSKSVVR